MPFGQVMPTKTPFQKKKLDPPLGSTAARLLDLHEEIVSDWASRVRLSIGSAKDELQPILIDTLPAFLDNLAEALAPNYPREVATEGSSIASEHGGERARVTCYSAPEVMREYQLLRDVLFESLGREGLITESENRIIIRSIDQAMTESLTAYFLVHEGLREKFAMTLTHDLRNPLTAIRAASELILREPGRIEQVALLAARVSESVVRVDRMIQDLLDASRVRFGERLHFEAQEFELRSLIKATLEQLATVHGERFVLEGPAIQGWWNRDAFRRAIENLVINALKYGDPHQPVRVTLAQLHGRVVVCVHNLGKPIPIEEQESLFRSFMRAKSAQSGGKGGWGIGLTMVRGMAEGHGGSVGVDSSLERGTTFTIDVPLDSRNTLAHPTTPGTKAPV